MAVIRVLPYGDFEENTYVVGDASCCVVIDPGAPAAKIAPLIAGREVTAVLLTHTHLDHILGADDIRDATGAPLYAPIGEARGLEDPRINLSALYGYDVRMRPAEKTISGGETIACGSFRLEVRDTPGHSIGHVVFVGEGFVIAGDTLFAGSIGRTDIPNGSHVRLMESVRRELLTLPDETVVWPGHGPKTTVGVERKSNPFLR